MCAFLCDCEFQGICFEETRGFKSGICMHTIAWDNVIEPRAASVGWRDQVIAVGPDGGIRIVMSEVKFLDFCKADYCESICHGCLL